MTSFQNKFLVLCILTSLLGVVSSSSLNAQYRDAFSEKKKRQKIKKNNKKGLFTPFRNKFTVTEREFHICSIVCGLYYYHFICDGVYINFFSYFSCNCFAIGIKYSPG